MKRHRFDPFSFVFGALFVGLSVAVLNGASLGDLQGVWAWVVPTLVVAALIIGYSLRAALTRPTPVEPAVADGALVDQAEEAAGAGSSADS